MSAPCALFLFCAAVYATTVCATSTMDILDTMDYPAKQEDGLMKKVEIFDGVHVKFPRQANNTNKLFSVEIDTKNSLSQGRGKKKNLMERILPMFIMPFLIQSAIVPMFLSMLKFMLFKALMVGKVAMALIIFNAFRNHSVPKGRDAVMAELHYGYQGNDEYGAYINH